MAHRSPNFQDDARSLIQEVEEELLSLEKNPRDPKNICRCANSLRTIQGVANLFNLDNITRLTGLAADGLDASCKLNQDVDPKLITATLELLDNLRHTGASDLDGRATHNITAILAPFATTTLRHLAPNRSPSDTKILVVDDEAVNRALLEEFIRSFNKDIKVTVVDSAAEAIFYYLTEEFDLVFLDIMMPEVDGNHFISIVEKNRAVHNIGGEANIVVQTAVQSMEELLSIIRKDCILEVIRKPILRKRICTCIERYCPAFRQ
ncbi:MAG: response regulator [Proteobacteria bacterium]|nr:response regulator [Pseudomonadota bacterium]MBU1639703.1 response regulator [Pseudomonadota bacterium]